MDETTEAVLNRGLKLLVIYDILRRESDYAHPMPKSVLIEKLAREYGIKCNEKTLKKEMDTINSCKSIEVFQIMKGHQKCYYTDDAIFDTAELEMLIKAVQAAKFINRDKTDELVHRIAAIGGEHRKKLLLDSTINFNYAKTEAKNIFHIIDVCSSAIHAHTKVLIKHFHLDEKRKKIYSNDGNYREISPLGFIYEDDNLYLYSFDEGVGEVRCFRVDRIDAAYPTDEEISAAAIGEISEAESYIRRVFRMYDGDSQTVTLSFTREMCEHIYEKFGPDVRIYKDHTDKNGREWFKITERVSVAGTFYGWLLQFGGQIRISSPSSVIEDYRNYLSKTIKTLNTDALVSEVSAGEEES